MPEPNDIVAALKAHPFTLASLSDREKFHTGMLAYTLRYLLDHERDAGLKLVQALWGEGADLRQLQDAKTINVIVEKKSVDLSLAADRRVVLFAEMKLKTSLADHQLTNYQRKHPAASGVVLGLFCEETGMESIPSRKFPQIISQALTHVPLARRLAAAKDDAEVLIRMWANYLGTLTGLAESFEKLELQQIENPTELEVALDGLRLKGAFEAYRYRRIAAGLRTLDCPVTPKAINTHGNAGLHFGIKADMPFGLQWQAKALKLFVEDPEYVSGQQSPHRDSRLTSLATDYLKEFDLDGPPELGPNGKFRSVVVSRWDVFDDCAGRAEHLVNGLKFLSKRGIDG